MQNLYRERGASNSLGLYPWTRAVVAFLFGVIHLISWVRTTGSSESVVGLFHPKP